MVTTLSLKVFAGASGLEKQIEGGYASDLLSDVMGNAAQGMVWLTLQTHKNVLAIASLKDLSAVILVNHHQPNPETIAQADEEGIPLLGSHLPAFELAGKIYSLMHS